MKTNQLKTPLIFVPLVLAVGALTGALARGGTVTEVVTPSLSSPGQSGSCFSGAIGFAYENPTNIEKPYVITWPAGCSNCTITLTPNTNTPPLSGYTLRPILTYTKPGIPPLPNQHDCLSGGSGVNSACSYTANFGYVPTNVIPELVILSVTNNTVTNSITFALTPF